MRNSLVLAALLAATACGGTTTATAPTPRAATAAPASATQLAPISTFVSGTLTLHQGTGKRGTPCYGEGGYGDIGVGTQVIVTDAASATVALGRLDEGARDVAGDCVFPFSLMVPTGPRIYGIEVAHRGRVQFEAEALRQPVSLTLGD